MSTEETHKIAEEWMGYVTDNHYEKLDALAAPDANWFMSGLKEKIPVAGDMPYAERRKAAQDLNCGADKSTTDILGLTVEGNVAIYEVFRTLEGPGDRHYQTYAIVKMTVVNGKIQEIREYIDFFALYKYFGVPGFADGPISKFLRRFFGKFLGA